MEILRKIFLFFNLLSLDVVFGAIAGMLFFSDLLEVEIPLSSFLLLGLAVWSIYTFDHLMDARTVKGKPQTPRHQIHQNYFWVLFPLAISSILVGFVLVFSNSELVFIIIPGIVLGFVTVGWMVFLKLAGQGVSWLKEISTALMYVAGISLAPFVKMEYEMIDKNVYFFVIIYFLAALVNLLMLSYMDSDEDKKDGFGSILVLISKSQLKKFIAALGGIGIGMLMILALILPSFYHIHSLILGFILGYHLILFFSKSQNKDQVRRKSEVLFLLPMLLLLF
jgi:hypothetical protein